MSRWLVLGRRWVLCGIDVLHFPHSWLIPMILIHMLFDFMKSFGGLVLTKKSIFWHINLRIVSGCSDDIEGYILNTANRSHEAGECLSEYRRFRGADTSPVMDETLLGHRKPHKGMNKPVLPTTPTQGMHIAGRTSTACHRIRKQPSHLFNIQIVTSVFDHGT